MRALVTGANGFVGQYLVRELLNARWRVSGFGVGPARMPRGVSFREIDVAKLRPADLKGAKPDVVFHLAAISNVPFSKGNPQATFEINAAGTAALYRALEERRIRCRVVFVGSGDIYAASRRPIREEDPVEPANPYSASKLCADAISRAWAARGWDIVILRPFNHTGPGQATSFVAPTIAEQIARAEAGRGPARVRIGNVTPVRDFSDVRDIARAYRLAAERAKAGVVYNVSSDRGTPIWSVLGTLLSLTPKKLKVVTDSSRMRGDALSIRVGCSARFRKAAGWIPQIPLETTLEDLLQHHRSKLRRR